MAKLKMQYCFNCGHALGVFEALSDDLLDCGMRRCVEEARNQRAAEDAEARARAEDDDYRRYR